MQASSQAETNDVVKLSGVMRGLRKVRAEANFVFTDADRAKMGIIAVSAAIAGLAGQAIATASASFEEDADYLEFTLDGQPVKGWVWRNPFREGDTVEVAAEWMGTHYEAYAIARPKDRVIALYPHCSRGRLRHYINAFFWWIVGTFAALVFSGAALMLVSPVIGYFSESEGIAFVVGFFLLCAHFFLLFASYLRYGAKGVCAYGSFFVAVGSIQLFQSEFLLTEFQYLAMGLYAFSGLMTFSLSRKWLPFVRLSERCFRTLGLPDPSGMDLVKRTKATRQSKDSVEMGVFYFRY